MGTDGLLWVVLWTSGTGRGGGFQDLCNVCPPRLEQTPLCQQASGLMLAQWRGVRILESPRCQQASGLMHAQRRGVRMATGLMHAQRRGVRILESPVGLVDFCLLYTSDAADD